MLGVHGNNLGGGVVERRAGAVMKWDERGFPVGPGSRGCWGPQWPSGVDYADDATQPLPVDVSEGTGVKKLDGIEGQEKKKKSGRCGRA